jgi:hypothetical protein
MSAILPHQEITPRRPDWLAGFVDGTTPADLTVTGLARALLYSWAEQEQRVGL